MVMMSLVFVLPSFSSPFSVQHCHCPELTYVIVDGTCTGRGLLCRAVSDAEGTSDGNLYVGTMQTAPDFTESAIFALEGLGFYCLQLDRCHQSNVKIRNTGDDGLHSPPVRHLAVQYTKRRKQQHAGDFVFEFKAGLILVANFNLHQKVCPLLLLL